MENCVNMGWYSILRARSCDIPSVVDIDSVSIVSRTSPAWFEERRVTYRDRFLIARANDTGEIIGYLSAANELYYPHDLPGYVYLSRFAVKKEFRRAGIGSAILLNLYGHLQDSGDYNGVVADVRKSNEPSLSFFIKKHAYSVKGSLCVKNWYESGNTEEDRHKIVVYKSFGDE